MLLGSSPEPGNAPRRFLDRPRVLIALGAVLIAIMAALFWLASRTRDLAPALVTDVLLYAVRQAAGVLA